MISRCVMVLALTCWGMWWSMGCGPGGFAAGDGGSGGEVDGGADGGALDASVDRPFVAGDGAPCTATSAVAAEVVRPADIIWVIDNSGSMRAEEVRVQNNINSFATTIGNTGIDYRVIMITAADNVNVPAPLGGSPNFLAVDQTVSSHDSLELIISTYPQWQSFLRPDSVKHFVVVSDDESDMSKTDFETAIGELADPGFPDGFVFHAIVAEYPPLAYGTPCFMLSAGVGKTYIDLQTAHGGVFYSLCLTDWTPVFVALSASVVDGVQLPCTYAIPEPPAGQTLQLDAVNFIYTPGGGYPYPVPYVGDAGSCGPTGGWYYDDPTTPTQIIVCPQTCSMLENDPTGTVEVAFGCATIIG